MRGHTQLYHQPQSAKRYSVAEICFLVESGIVNATSVADRHRMKQVLKNNIEAQEGFARRAEPHLKAGYLNEAQKLKKVRTKIQWN